MQSGFGDLSMSFSFKAEVNEELSIFWLEYTFDSTWFVRDGKLDLACCNIFQMQIFKGRLIVFQSGDI
jgi:hypothetical protein